MNQALAPLDPGMIKLHRTGTGTPLVLLHCLGVDHGLWNIAAAGLEQSHTILSYDFPGHHEAKLAPRPFTVEDLADQLAAVLTREKIDKAHVGGISLGGLVAQVFAARYPARVDRLILMDTTARYTDEAREGWHQRAATARTKGVPALIDNLLKIWFTDGFVAKNPAAAAYVRERFQKCSGEGYAMACECLAAADLRPLAAKITAPTLVVCGDEDVPAFQDAARWLAANIKGAKLEWLAPARHASVLEQPAAFVAAMRKFLG